MTYHVKYHGIIIPVRNMMKKIGPRASKEEELSLVKQEIERVTKMIKEENGNFPTIPSDLSDDDKGSLLLEAFLNDLPFDRFVFAYLPVKISFLNASFRTFDPEIVAYALNQVRNSLDQRAFEQLLDCSPHFRGAYDHFSKPKVSSVIKNVTNIDERLFYLKNELSKASGLMKEVIKDEIDRIKGKTFTGMLEVDLKWEMFQNKEHFNIQALAPKFGLFGKWKKNVSPLQAALVARSLNYPDTVVNAFLNQITDKNEKAQKSYFFPFGL